MWKMVFTEDNDAGGNLWLLTSGDTCSELCSLLGKKARCTKTDGHWHLHQRIILLEKGNNECQVTLCTSSLVLGCKLCNLFSL